MAIHTLSRRWRTGPLAVVRAETLGRAVEVAAAAGVALAYAELSGVQAAGASLVGVDLRGADLADADLRGADLTDADLRGAILCDADLRHADLTRCRFQRADLRGVRLTGARFDGALLDWRHPAFAVELLRRDPRCQGDALKLAFELAVEADDRPYAWLRAVLRRQDLVEWAAAVLAPAIAPGDDAPPILRKLAADVAPATRSTTDSPLYWTRRR